MPGGNKLRLEREKKSGLGLEGNMTGYRKKIGGLRTWRGFCNQQYKLQKLCLELITKKLIEYLWNHP